MNPAWFNALADTDAEAAAALAPLVGTETLMPLPPPEESEALAREWMAQHMPSPNMAVVAGPVHVDLIPPLFTLFPDLRILVLDRDPARLAGALNAIDRPALAEAVRSGRLVIDPGELKDAGIDRFLRAADFSRVPTIRLVDVRDLSDEDCRMADDMTRPARELLRLQACDMSTRLRFGKTWQVQTLANIPAIIRNPGINTLFGKFAGRPALVVAAGPSLDETFPLMRKLRDRFMIIAVGRVVTRLVKVGKIVPDLIVTGDGQDFVKKHFAHRPAGVPVAASIFTHPEAVAVLDRIFFMEVESMGLSDWLRERIGPRGVIHAGGNVSTAAISVAVELGCNPVLTVGLDLSYAEDGRTHARRPLTDEEQAAQAAKKRLLYDVPGNYQPLVKTNRQMMHYVEFTRELVAYYSETKFVNINTAGARIDGMELIRPERLEEFAGEVRDTASDLKQLFEAHAGDINPVEFCEKLREDCRQLGSLRSECLDAGMTCNRLIMLMRRPGKGAMELAQSYLNQLAPVDFRLKNDPVMNLIEARLESATRLLAERMMTKEQIAQSPGIRSNWRWREFYKGVADACEVTIKRINSVMATIEATTPARDATIIFEENQEPAEALV